MITASLKPRCGFLGNSSAAVVAGNRLDGKAAGKQELWEDVCDSGCRGLFSAGTAFPRWLQGCRQKEIEVCSGVFRIPH